MECNLINACKWIVPDKTRPNALYNAWFSVQWTSFASAVFPRLCQTAFTFAQPFLISRAIALAVTPQTTEYNNVGYGLIGAYVLVYGGIAVSPIS
jgi:ATP-binding cassette, subfamily C (CFTR/MRP), member 1